MKEMEMIETPGRLFLSQFLCLCVKYPLQPATHVLSVCSFSARL